MLEHRYDIRMWESCVEPNLLMVERQDPDNCIRFQTRERCALEIAAYVFNPYKPGILFMRLRKRGVQLLSVRVLDLGQRVPSLRLTGGTVLCP